MKKFEAVTLCLELHSSLLDLPALNRDDHAVGESWSGKKVGSRFEANQFVQEVRLYIAQTSHRGRTNDGTLAMASIWISLTSRIGSLLCQPQRLAKTALGGVFFKIVDMIGTSALRVRGKEANNTNLY